MNNKATPLAQCTKCLLLCTPTKSGRCVPCEAIHYANQVYYGTDRPIRITITRTQLMTTMLVSWALGLGAGMMIWRTVTAYVTGH